jgi:hypothetical protein
VNDQAQIAQDKNNIRTERADIAQDRSNIRSDEQNIRQTRQDIRANQADLHNDRNVIAANTQNVQPQRSPSPQLQDQRASPNGVEPMKPALTSSTVANNAAENTHRTQAAQNLQKAWWHVW